MIGSVIVFPLINMVVCHDEKELAFYSLKEVGLICDCTIFTMSFSGKKTVSKYHFNRKKKSINRLETVDSERTECKGKDNSDIEHNTVKALQTWSDSAP